MRTRAELAVCSLGSGSKGNCILLRSPEGAILVDAGLSGREIQRRMALAECPGEELQGLLLTHAHSDHCSGAGILARRLAIPVYGSAGTLSGAHERFRGGELKHTIADGKSFVLAGIRITPFRVPHDCRQPLMFRFERSGHTIVVLTDLGFLDPTIVPHIRQANILLLESNYDPRMLANGPYPASLKKRISGGRGHISNPQCAELLCRIQHPGLRQVLLGHISENNNLPRLALEESRRALDAAGRADLPMETLSQHRPSDWFELGTEGEKYGQLELLDSCA